MLTSISSSGVDDVLGVVPLGQPGFIRHILAARDIRPDSLAMSEIVFKAAVTWSSDREFSRSFAYLME